MIHPKHTPPYHPSLPIFATTGAIGAAIFSTGIYHTNLGLSIVGLLILVISLFCTLACLED